VISAEIAARCRRVLRVRPLDPAPPKRGETAGSGTYAGSSSQGKAITFRVSRGTVRDLRVGVHFTCSDNTTQGGNSILAPKPSPADQALLDRFGIPVVDRRLSGDETIGPFPALGTTRAGFAASYAAPNSSALYDLRGSFSGGSWTGTVRIVEGWRTSPLGFIPDPDGGFVCDTGEVSFSVSR
jgi:hypothetical protein